MLAYTLSGVDAADIADENMDGDYNALTGTTTVIGNMATIAVGLAADEFTDGEDVLTVMLDNGSAANNIVVNDTSTTPLPTYTLYADTYSVDEGATANFTVNTTNVADYTMLAYTLSGVDAADVTDGWLTGTTTVIGNMATIAVGLAADEFTDGEDVLTVMLDNGSAANYIVVNDTSTTPLPTYTLYADTYSVNEGEWANFTVNTTNVADYTSLFYTLNGDNIDETDIADGSRGGSVEVYDGYASIAVALAVDDIYEGEEMLTLTVFDEFGFGAWTSVTVYDF
jgi:formylmethanofuran dehydrogenase subunit D